MHDKLKEYKKFSQILLTATLLMIGLILCFTMVHSYQQNLENAEKSELRNLFSIAKTIALNIDGDVHKNLVCAFSEKDAIVTNSENKTYEKFHQLLKKTQEVNELASPIYTLFRSSSCNPSPDENSFLFGISSSTPNFRHSYESYPKNLAQSFDTGGTTGEYYDDHGHWLSAFYPIKNRNGETVAVVQVDELFGTFEAEALATLMSESIYAIVFLGVLIGVFFYVYRRILNSMAKINMTLEDAVSSRTVELHESNLKLKKLNEQLESIVENRTKELQSSNKKLESFARVASHDLQAPLRLITSFSQLFKRKYKNLVDEQGKEYLDYITTNTKKMSVLITDILSTSLTATANAHEIRNVDLNEIMDQVVSNLEIDISKYQATIHYKNLPAIRGFSSEFVQLFQNFISNSVKYSRPNIPPVINIFSEDQNEDYKIIISDNGKGISEEAIQTIFKEFDRGDATDDEGYGIGLATCSRIINEYFGSLKVTSKVGVGTSFEIILKDRKSVDEAYKESVEASLGSLQN